MFDLNLSFQDVPVKFISLTGKMASKKLNELSLTQMENSRTSDSSIINIETTSTAGDDEYSCLDHCCDGYVFDILKADRQGIEGTGNRGGLLQRSCFHWWVERLSFCSSSGWISQLITMLPTSSEHYISSAEITVERSSQYLGVFHSIEGLENRNSTSRIVENKFTWRILTLHMLQLAHLTVLQLNSKDLM